MKARTWQSVLAGFWAAVLTFLAALPTPGVGQCPACLVSPPPEVLPAEIPIATEAQMSVSPEVGDATATPSEEATTRQVSTRPARRVYASAFVSAPVSARFEVAAAIDMPVEFPQVFAAARLRKETARLPAILGGISSVLALNDFATPGLFAAKRTAFWGQATKTLGSRVPIQVSVGGQKIWSSADAVFFGSVVISPSSRAQARGTLVGGAFYPGIAVRPYREWWLRTTYLRERRAIALNLLWQPTPSFPL